MFKFRLPASQLRKNASAGSLSGTATRSLVATLLLGTGLAEAKTVYVNSAVSKPGNGTTWAGAHKYLRDALDKSVANDVIWVAKGTYYPDEGATGAFGDRQKSFELKGQKIYGGFAGNEAKLDQRNPQLNPTNLSGAIWDGPNEDVYWSLHVVVVNASSVLDGVTVSDGRANGASVWSFPNITEYDQGGGCYVQSGVTLTLFGCNFFRNQAFQYGGAIAMKDDTGKVMATNCLFERNSIESFPNKTPTIATGGAIKGNVEAVNCRFLLNSVYTRNGIGGSVATSLGGAIAGDVTAVRCIFSGNSVEARPFFDATTPDANPVASGGAVFGNIIANQCTFSENQATTPYGYTPSTVGPPVLAMPVVDLTDDAAEVVIPLVGVGVSSGGAIAGGSVAAVNCSFSLNKSATGKINKKDGTGSGGGGAIFVLRGVSSLVNCVFSSNTSGVRGGAIHSATKEFVESVVISNCTFVDNGVGVGFRGAALSCGGIVRILNNVFWYTTETANGFRRDNLVRVIFDGVLRNSPENYPDPTTVAPNIVKGGQFAVSTGLKGNTFLGPVAVSLINTGDPLFANITDPDGPDNTWGTADDGLRIGVGSPAIGFIRDPRITDPENFLLKDTADVDLDGNRTELIPVDMAGVVRVQDRFVDIGAYEFGNTVSAPEIAVFAEKGVELSNNGGFSFGSTTVGSNNKKIFTVRNIGQTSLKNLSFSINGSKAYTVKKSVVKTLAEGSELKLTVTFKPSRKGLAASRLVITSDDADENPFTVKLSGKGLIKKKKKSHSLNSNSVVTSSTQFDLFGAVATSDTTDTTTEIVSGNQYLVLTVQKPVNLSETDPVVEVSTNLLDWFSGPEHTTTLLSDRSTLKVRDNTPFKQGEKRYIRAK